MKYYPFFNTFNTIAFVRQPVDHIISLFLHYKRLYNYYKPIEDFITDKSFCNLQSKYLEGRPLELYGFIGITERYKESVNLMNVKYGFNISVKKLNANNSLFHSSNKYLKDRALVELINKMNQKDTELYQKSLKIFDSKIAAYNAGVPHFDGCVEKLDKKKILGWASLHNSSDPVEIDIYVNDIHKETVIACGFKPAICPYSTVRKGFIGFNCNLNKLVEENDTVVCKIAQTGQILQGPQRINRDAL